MVNIKQGLRWIPEYLDRIIKTQPWNLALVICFLAGQIFLRTYNHTYLRLAPVIALLFITLALRHQASFGPRIQYTKALLIPLLCLSFTLKWESELQRQARFYQKNIVLNQGVRPIMVKGYIEEDFTFRINKPIQSDPDAWITVPFRLESGEKIELGLKQNQWLALEVQRVLDVKGHLQVLRQAANPGGYNAHTVGAGRGIYLRLNATSIRGFYDAQNITWQERARSLRTSLFSLLRNAQGDEFGGFYLALWTGDRRFVSERLLKASNTLGIAYRLSPNGQHLGIWFLAMPDLLRIYDRKHRPVIKILILLIITLLTGGSIPLFKGILLQSLTAYQARHRINRSRGQTLGLVACILLAYQPGLIVHPGFLLSMGVSYILVWPQWTRQQMEDFAFVQAPKLINSNVKYLVLRQKVLRLLTLAVLLPTLLDIVDMTSNRLTMITMFFVPILQMIGVPILLLSRLIPEAGQWLVDQMVQLGGDLTQANFKLLPLDTLRILFLGFIVNYQFLLRYFAVWRITFDKRKLRALTTALSILAIFLSHLCAWPIHQELRVTYFSVGSADMILCETRDSAYLIDTGENEGHAKILNEALILRRRPGLEAIVLTHEDQDHSGGIHDVLSHTPVNMVLSPPQRSLSLGMYEKLRREVVSPLTWQQEKLHFTLYPAQEELQLKENDRSLVLLLEGSLNLLFTGDIEAKRELALLEHLEEVDLLKVPHHGSRTSSTEAFVDHIKPKLAIISVGPRHGHPHDEVLERFAERKIPTYRTDIHGAITFIVRRGKGMVKATYGPENEYGLLSSFLRGDRHP